MLAIVTATAALALGAASSDWYVDVSNTQCEAATGSSAAPFCTLAEALAAALDGDTIHIAPGTYFEALTLSKDLTLIGTSGASQTILDGSATAPLVVLYAGTDTVLRGLTLQNGFGYAGGAISQVDDSAPTSFRIEGCVLQNNVVEAGIALGGAIYMRGGDATIVDSMIVGNTARATTLPYPDAYGGGIYAYRGSLTMVRTVVANNNLIAFCTAGGGGISASQTLLDFADCEISGNSSSTGYPNSGGGLLCSSFPGTISGTIVRTRIRGNFGQSGAGISASMPMTLDGVEISDNVSTQSGSGLSLRGHPYVIRNSTIVGDQPPALVYVTNSATVQMESSIVWGDANGSDLIQGDVSSLNGSVVDYSNIRRGWSRAGVGNIAVFPSFVDRPGGDFRLRTSSPCIDAGNPSFASTELDLDGGVRLLDGDLDRVSIVDMGAYELSHARLTITGDAVPGGTLTAAVGGSAGLTGFLAVGPQRDDGLTLPPWGTLFLELGPTARVFGVGTIPASLDFPIPPTLSSTVTLTFQALAFGLPLANGKLPGTLSNPVTVTVQP